MYSVVMLMALTTGGDLPACHRGGDWCCDYYGGYGCGGYYGGWSNGCCGYYNGCGGYYGGWSNGCCSGYTGYSGYSGYSYSYSAPATIIVSLPADAKLTIDDAATVSTSAHRVFQSPDLAMGREFYYTLKAEFSHDGKPVAISKKITVRAGEETKVTLEANPAGVASK
jgi:uncharacterized protein (TIGR03000 family)